MPVLLKKRPFHPPSILVCVDTDDVSSGRGGSRQSRLLPGQALYYGDDLEQIVRAELISGGSQPWHCLPHMLLSGHERDKITLLMLTVKIVIKNSFQFAGKHVSC